MNFNELEFDKLNSDDLCFVNGGSAVGVLGGALGGATTGVRVGTAAGPWGMLVGGVIGGLAGGGFAAWTGS